jgi:hypothetical protein
LFPLSFNGAIADFLFIKNNAEWSSLEARLAHAQKVIGSNPISAITLLLGEINEKDVNCYKSN